MNLEITLKLVPSGNGLVPPSRVRAFVAEAVEFTLLVDAWINELQRGCALFKQDDVVKIVRHCRPQEFGPDTTVGSENAIGSFSVPLFCR